MAQQLRGSASLDGNRMMSSSPAALNGRGHERTGSSQLPSIRSIRARFLGKSLSVSTGPKVVRASDASANSRDAIMHIRSPSGSPTKDSFTSRSVSSLSGVSSPQDGAFTRSANATRLPMFPRQAERATSPSSLLSSGTQPSRDDMAYRRASITPTRTPRDSAIISAPTSPDNLAVATFNEIPDPHSPLVATDPTRPTGDDEAGEPSRHSREHSLPHSISDHRLSAVSDAPAAETLAAPTVLPPTPPITPPAHLEFGNLAVRSVPSSSVTVRPRSDSTRSNEAFLMISELAAQHANAEAMSRATSVTSTDYDTATEFRPESVSERRGSSQSPLEALIQQLGGRPTSRATSMHSNGSTIGAGSDDMHATRRPRTSAESEPPHMPGHLSVSPEPVSPTIATPTQRSAIPAVTLSEVGLGPPPLDESTDSSRSLAEDGRSLTPRTAKRWSIVEMEQAYSRMKDILKSSSRNSSYSIMTDISEAPPTLTGDAAFERVVQRRLSDSGSTYGHAESHRRVVCRSCMLTAAVLEH